jgi:transmembrane sensor
MGLLNRPNTYTTGMGELRSVVLEDDSTVELNVHSQVRVRFSRAQRMVELVAGEALFRVKKDAARPFIVLTSGTSVRAVGTQFDVYRKATGITVTVVEGRVAVTEGKTPILLSAGNQVTVAPRAIPKVIPTDATAVTAWTQRKLIFNETPLREAAAEFNRYNSRQIVIEDASLADYHIRGTFEAGNPDRLLQFLRDRFDTDVRATGNEIHISRK